MAFADHFSDRAKQYASFRPTYPLDMIQWIADLAPGKRVAWDCATGNGQAAVLLGECFDDVIATDASEEQIKSATAHPRVRYAVASERASGLHDASVDLVTVAQALHWFDLPAFFAEVDRVLRSNGVLAVWSYGKPSVEGPANKTLWWFHDERVGPFWPAERMNVENGYRLLELPYPEIPAAARTLTARMTRAMLTGYVGTWSAVRQARLQEGHDPMIEFAQQLASSWPDEIEQRTVSWPLTLRVCQRPVRLHAAP